MPIADADKINLYRQMVLARRFEQGASEAYADGFIGGFMHLYIGQEAVATGAISALNHDDNVVGSYRDHAHALCRGSSARELMAELYGRSTGICGGKGGSMHFYDAENHFMGGYAIVGGQLPIAAGLGLAMQMRQEDRIVMCFFGDGASNQGVFHEALNMAKLWSLPVLFICENNFYGIATGVSVSSSYNEIYRKASGYGIPGHVCNGMDVLEVRNTCDELVRFVRQGTGPVLLEARCYRYQGHSMTDPGRYRARAEEELWRRRDPIPRLAKHLLQKGVVDAERIERIERETDEEVQEAMRFAEASPEPEPAALWEHVYVEEPRRG
jgi:pyruvate dehydrogenase E1 component alpha subunit